MDKSIFVREVRLSEKTKTGIRCLLCERRCNLREGMAGVCGVRKVEGGKLLTLVYGRISALEMRPIEIKPFHHFFPGTYALTYSTYGCNFLCPWCQNWALSKAKPENGVFISSEEMVKIALMKGAQGICVSFNEPTLLHEYNLEVFRLARQYRLYNTYVSNGYMTELAALELIEAGLDAINIDIKGGPDVYLKIEKGTREDVIWRNARLFLDHDVHVEMIYLVIPGVNDDKKTIDSILRKHIEILGEDVPIHINRYYPAYKFNAPPTPVKKLVEIAENFKEGGLKYVYIGNIIHPLNHTYCPGCGTMLIERGTYTSSFTEAFDPEKGVCKKCGYKIWGRFKSVDEKRREDL